MAELRGIGKNFDGVSVLRNIDLDIYGGQVHALMGENGAGKSTLVKILSGVVNDYSGIISIAGQQVNFRNPSDAEAAGIAIMHQELSLVPYMSVAENVSLGHEPLIGGLLIDRSKAAENTRQLLSKFGFNLSPDTAINTLRVGEQQLVEIVRALSLNTKILIMDEPTSALSQAETEVLMEVIRDLALQGVAILYISHRMDEVFEIADRITVLRDGNLIGSAPIGDFERSAVVEMIVGHKLTDTNLNRSIVADRKIVLAAKNLCVDVAINANGNKSRRVLDDVSMHVHSGEILGITGLLGAGRTELLETLFGARSDVVSGEIEINGTREIIDSPMAAMRYGLALITEDRKNSGLLLNSSVQDNIALPSLSSWNSNWITARQKITSATLDMIHKLNIKCQGPEHLVNTLSGGNQQKVVLGKWLATEPQVLLLDEPTRGIDIGAKDEIYQLIGELADSGIAIIIASSEISELIAVCNRMIILCEGRKVGEIDKSDFAADLIKEMSMQFEA